MGGGYRGGYGYGGYGYRGGVGIGLGYGYGYGYPGYYGSAYYDPYYYGAYGYPYPYGYYPPVVVPRVGVGVAIRPRVVVGGGWRRFGR